MATHMAELGILPHIVEATLNHLSGHKSGIAGVYNRATYDDERAAALDQWANAPEAHPGASTSEQEPGGLYVAPSRSSLGQVRSECSVRRRFLWAAFELPFSSV